MFLFDVSPPLQAFLNQYWHIINYLLICGVFFLVYVTVKKPVYACAMLIVLFPTYLIRTKIFAFPSTYLEICFWTVFLTFMLMAVIQKQWIRQKNPYPPKAALVLFLGAATISIFTSGQIIKSLGLWRAYFL